MINLRPVKISRDLTYIFNVMANYSETYNFTRNVRVNSFEYFEEWFKSQLNSFYMKFLIIEDQSGQQLGFIYSYDYMPVDRHAQVSVYINPEYQDLGIAAEATILFLDMLFSQYNLLRVYSYVYDYNVRSLACNREAGFAEEGCLKEHKYYNRRNWDLHIFSMSATIFYEKYDIYLARIKNNGK